MNGRGNESQLAAALRAAGERARPKDDCPPADRIWAAARLELPLDERLATINHTTECPMCAEAWRLAIELRPPAEDSSVARPSRSTWLRQPRAWAWPSAAVLVLAMGAVLLLRTSRPGIEPVLRDPGAGVLRPLIESGASLPRDDFRLQWSGAPAGTRYDLTVTTSELDVLVMVRGLEDPSYRIPPGRLAELQTGSRLLWRVVARTPDGATIASPTFEVSVE